MACIRHFAADAPVEDIIRALERDGGAILDNVLSSDAAVALLAELRPFVEATELGVNEFGGTRTTRTGALIARSAGVRSLALNRAVRNVADKFLLPNCQRYQLQLTQLIRILSGQGAQDLHRDRWIWGSHLPDIEPQLSAIWALTDFTLENGATRIVPGSSKWPDERRPNSDEIAYAEMQAGSVVLFTGTVLHGGGANTSSDEERWGLNLGYSLGWLRQEENQYLSCPPEIARTLDPEIQALIGYTQAAPGLGYFTPPVAAGEDPGIVGPEYALGRADMSFTGQDAEFKPYTGAD